MTTKIDYVEIPSSNLTVSKAFFADVFGWTFVDYGDHYVDIQNAGLGGGLYTSDQVMSAEAGSALIVLKSDDLLASIRDIEAAGGTISKPIFGFPGGERFHFLDPVGNEFAVWKPTKSSE